MRSGIRRWALGGASFFLLTTMAGCDTFADDRVVERRASASVPLGAGTVGISPNGDHSVAVYPELSAAFVMDLGAQSYSRIDFDAGTRLGRVLLSDERGYIVDRAGDQVLVLDLQSQRQIGQLDTCHEPRGITLSTDRSVLHVACASGQLRSIRTEDGAVEREVLLTPDLRDVQVFEQGLAVSTFRSATILILDQSGTVTDQFTPQTDALLGTAQVAWRMQVKDERLYLLYQYSSERSLGAGAGAYYGSGCSGQVVMPSVSVFVRNEGTNAAASTEPTPSLGGSSDAGAPDLDEPVTPGVVVLQGVAGGGFKTQATAHLNGAAGAMDMAVTGESSVAVAVPGNGWAPTPRRSLVLLDNLTAGSQQNQTSCSPIANTAPDSNNQPDDEQPVVGVASSDTGVLVSQSAMQPGVVLSTGTRYVLERGTIPDDGSQAFNMSTDRGIACASCHPEGGDDGHTWQFASFGARRTQNLGGGISMRSAFHWDGSLKTFSGLMSEVFVGRMGGIELDQTEQRRLLGYLDRLPPAAQGPVAAPVLLEMGQALFEDETVGCASCHNGARFTDGALHNVGTGGTFITPSLLGVGTRAPYMHDGCSDDLQARFGACGGGDAHGVTSHLDDQQLSALVAYVTAL